MQEAPDALDHLETTSQDAEVTPASPPAGSHATTAQVIASPTAHPVVPPVACQPSA